MKITLSELKQIIREEVKITRRVLKENLLQADLKNTIQTCYDYLLDNYIKFNKKTKDDTLIKLGMFKNELADQMKYKSDDIIKIIRLDVDKTNTEEISYEIFSEPLISSTDNYTKRFFCIQPYIRGRKTEYLYGLNMSTWINANAEDLLKEGEKEYGLIICKCANDSIGSNTDKWYNVKTIEIKFYWE
jgi:hypothetical protein